MKPVASLLALALAVIPTLAFASETREASPSAKVEKAKKPSVQHAKTVSKGRARHKGMESVSLRTPAKKDKVAGEGKEGTREAKPAAKKADKTVAKKDSKHPHGNIAQVELPRGSHPAADEHDHAHGEPLVLEDKLPGEPAKKKSLHTVSLHSKDKAQKSEKLEVDAKTDASEKASKSKNKAAPKKAEPCLREGVEFIRGAEVDEFALTQCDGFVAPGAVEKLSVALRPGGAKKPEKLTFVKITKDKAEKDEKAKTAPTDVAPGIRTSDARLVERLQVVVDHFVGKGKKAKIAIISGYRPNSQGSFHAQAKAIDFRLEGVDNEKLWAFCKTMQDTGCGYYPNSSFVHMDARDSGAGHISWIDASGPGESPRYVASWPPPKAEKDDSIPSTRDDKNAAELPNLPEGEHAKDAGKAAPSDEDDKTE